VFPRPPQRPTPYLYSPAEIDRLVEAAGGLRPSLRAATYRTLFGLLAVTGMRVGEALKLHRGEVDLDQGVLTITGPKSGHMRLLPLHPTSVDALRRYAEQRERRFPTLEAGTFFVSTGGTPLLHGNVRATFIKLTTAIGLRTANVRPRIHDLRHSLAVRCLLEWYRSGADVAAHMPTLSTYLGHVNPAGTYWYLSATPELMDLAARRLDRHRGWSAVTALAPLLQAFFTDRLMSQRQASGHTIAAYRDTLRLLLGFAADRLGRPPHTFDMRVRRAADRRVPQPPGTATRQQHPDPQRAPVRDPLAVHLRRAAPP
jgi:site-specific recombinase XerD